MYDFIEEDELSLELLEILSHEGIYKKEDFVFHYCYKQKLMKKFMGITPKLWKEVKQYYNNISPLYDYITNPTMGSLRKKAFCSKFTNMLSKLHGSCEGLNNQIKRMQQTDVWEINAFISAINLVKYNTEELERYLKGREIERDMKFDNTSQERA